MLTQVLPGGGMPTCNQNNPLRDGYFGYHRIKRVEAGRASNPKSLSSKRGER